MKIKNIPEIDKSKSIKEVRVKINSILEKLEKKRHRSRAINIGLSNANST